MHLLSLMFIYVNLCVFSMTSTANPQRPNPPISRQHTNGCYILVIASLLTNGCEVFWGTVCHYCFYFLLNFILFFATLWFSESKTLMLLHTAPCVFVYFITNPVYTYINLTLYVIMIWFLCFTSPIKYYYGETTLLILLSANHWAFLKLQKASAISFWFN